MTRGFGHDNCLMPYQTQAAKGTEYAGAGRVKEYNLTPEELAEVHRKYGPPGVKPEKKGFFITAERKKPLFAAAKGKEKKKPLGGKIRAEKLAPPPKEKKLRKTRKEHPHTRHITKEELELALEQGGTLKGAQKILHIGSDVLTRYIKQHGITYYNRHFTHRDADGKVCGTCKEYKKWDQYNKNKSMLDGYESKCRDCSNLYRRARKVERKEKISNSSSDKCTN